MTNNDTGTLKSIIEDLNENLMIEAGAGTGKTYALVSRVVALVKARRENAGDRCYYLH